MIVDSLAESLKSSIKSIILSDLDLPEGKTVSDTAPDNQYMRMFGRRFCNLDYKHIVYIIHDDYMNNVDRFILEKKGKPKIDVINI